MGLSLLGNSNNNLPHQPTSFIGREKEVAEVKDWLAKTRLLTLTGAGGSGKTRLSLQAAAELLNGGGDGVWLVELATLADPTLVPQTVANVLGIKEQAGKTVLQSIVDYLQPKRLLLVLDNCEHLLPACASLAANLLRNCPYVRLLASSHEPLNVSGEQTYRVPSLSLPDLTQTQSVESLSQYEAARLFIERAQAVQSEFAVTEANALTVDQICRRLDGIPLAIELAAARVRALSVEEINERLDNRFHLLTGGARDKLPRQQTLRALIDWSYDLLSEQEKTVLQRLSVFAGGWTVEAAESVCSGDGIEDFEMIDLLMGLADKSLAVAEYEDSAVWYRMLETIRQYAHDRLKEKDGERFVRNRHMDWYTRLAEEAEAQLNGPEQRQWLGRLETEHDNFREALAWCQNSEVLGNLALRLGGALGQFWDIRGYYSEGRQWLKSLLELHNNAQWSTVYTHALFWAGSLACAQGDYNVACELHEQSLTVSQQLENDLGIATSLNSLGRVAYFQGKFSTARGLHERALTIWRQLGDQTEITASLTYLGNIADFQGDFSTARSLHNEALALSKQSGYQRGVAISLNSLGRVAYFEGDYTKAQELHKEALAISRQLVEYKGIAASLNSLGNIAYSIGDYDTALRLSEEALTIRLQLGDQRGVANSLNSLANISYSYGDFSAAQALYEESLTIRRQLKDQHGYAYSLEGMAGVAFGQNQLSRAAQLSGAAYSLHTSIGGSVIAAEQEKSDKQIALIRQALGDVAFAAAWDSGRAMALEQAVDYALARQ